MRVEVNFDEVLRQLTAFEKKQVPFAAAKTLTDAAQSVKVRFEELIDQGLDRPTPFTKRGVFIKSATKTRLEALVGIKNRQASYLRYQRDGGVRQPKKRAIVIAVGQRLNKYGNMPKRAVERLLGRKDTFSGTVDGTPGIWKRLRGGKLRLMAIYVDQATYDPILDFDQAFRSEIARHMPVLWARNYAQALRTAK